MAGERGNFVLNDVSTHQIDNMGKSDRRQLAKDLRKRARKDAQTDPLQKGDTSIAPVPGMDASATGMQTASFHVDEANRHRKKAKKAREGKGMISLAHGEAVGRLHDAAADWHEAQARNTQII